jgi:uncharacterized DUF497 family protein
MDLLPFRTAITLFAGSFRKEEDLRRDYGERRIIAVGQVEGEILVCVYTERGTARRIISLRRANRKERHAYRTGQLG